MITAYKQKRMYTAQIPQANTFGVNKTEAFLFDLHPAGEHIISFRIFSFY